ncbi:MAG TPA: L,D-transpeptidase [Prolixibacteraceae bacterium]|nr:L,D-transpeptidase [Prolixibacteraceae bacterium]
MGLGKKFRLKWFIIGLVSVLVIAISISVIIVSQKTLPTEDLRLAREALSIAKEAEANIYSEVIYKKSVQLYDSAMVNWSRENTRFILFRDYTRVIDFAKRSKKTAEEAKDEAIKKSANLSKDVEAAFVSLAKKIELYNKLFKDLPLPKSVFDAHNKSKMYLSESKIAHEGGKLKEAEMLFKKAEIYTNHANVAAAKMLRDYFEDHGHWTRLANDAIAASRGGNKVILVDKVAHILYVYQSGKVIRSYEAEFGPNWMAHKERNGDKATPEGNYHITKKKERGATIYHKALLLDYPNAEDRARFQAKKKKGLISRNAGIGSLIEIHGNGGKGFNWTSGCVGLKDRDMDDLYRLVGSGTRVTIVGSIEPLSVVSKGLDF